MITEENNEFFVYIINGLGTYSMITSVMLLLTCVLFTISSIVALNYKLLGKLLNHVEKKKSYSFLSSCMVTVVCYLIKLAQENEFIFRITKGLTYATGVAGVLASLGSQVSERGQIVSPSLTSAGLILCLTIICIVLSIQFAPRKLFISMGAGIAFVFTAFLYEGFIFVIEFIESTNST